MLGTLVGGRISVASAGLSAAKSGLTIAIRYGNRRRQFGPKDEPETPILDYRTHQRRLFPPLANAYALTFALADVRQRFAARHPDEDTRTIEALASGLKAFSSWNTTATLQTARETCGGQGYLIINRIADLKADTDVYTTFEGDNTVLMLQVAKGLLTEFRQEFSDINFFGLVKYVSDKAATALKEQNPVIIRNTDEAHLRDPEFQLAAFRYREQWILQSVAKRLKKRIAGGMDSYDAFIEVQNQLLDLSQASIERAILERFISGLHAIEDETLRPMLKLLCDLFALHHLDQDRGWFLAHGYFESAKARAIHYQIDRLCAEIRPHAGALVDAFAIPDELLAAPIGVKETVS
jgi:acyl-CoA oxidase